MLLRFLERSKDRRKWIRGLLWWYLHHCCFRNSLGKPLNTSLSTALLDHYRLRITLRAPFSSEYDCIIKPVNELTETSLDFIYIPSSAVRCAVF